MTSSFFGLEIANRALRSQQLALDITGHNISNANSPGYSRQIGQLQSTPPFTTTSYGHQLSVGTGVSMENITRTRDAFVDSQLRLETSKQNYWGARQNTLQKMESVINEPTDTGLQSNLDAFWNAWSDLSKNPENMGARAVVQEQGQAIADSLQHVAIQVSDMTENLNQNIKVNIHQINNYASQLKDLNNQIKQAEVAGDNPNDLKDKRDAIVDELSELVNVRVIETRDTMFTDREVNNYKIVIGNDTTTPLQTLVDNTAFYTLTDPPATDASGNYTITWETGVHAGNAVDLGTHLGQLGSNQEARDTYLPAFLTQYDQLANALATALNAVHTNGQGLNGSTGLDFFVSSDGLPINASNIRSNGVLKADLSKIATAASGVLNPGDGSTAQAISSFSGGWDALAPLGLSDPLNASSFADFYDAHVAQVGVDVQQSNGMKTNEDILVSHITNQRESLSGVSLDEEMTNLVKYQKSYTAAARLVNIIDTMLETVLNLGITK